MNRITKAAARDLYFNKSRSLVVILALILITSVPLALINVSPNLNQIIEEEESEYQLAHFNYFFENPIEVSIIDKLKIWSSEFLNENPEDISIEGRIHLSSKIQALGSGDLKEGSWLDLDFISINENRLPEINQLVLDEGRFPNNSDEAILLTSLARADGIKIGDTIETFGPAGTINFLIVGFVQSIEYASYDLSQTGALYSTYEGLLRYLGESYSEPLFNSFIMFFDFQISISEMRDLYEHIVDEVQADPTIGSNLVFVWFTRETSFRKGMQDALGITAQYLFAASLFVFLVAGVIIFVTMNRYINEQKTVIGAMYAYGVRKRGLLYSFFYRIFILSIFSTVIGLFLAKLILEFLVGQLVEQWGLISTSSEITIESIIFILVASSIISYGFTFIAVVNLIKLTPYEAMRGKTSELKNRGILFKLSGLLPTKVLRFAGKNLTRNRTRTILTMIAFTLSITFSGSLMFTDHSIDYTINDYYENRINYDLEISVGFENSNNQTLKNEIMTLDTNSNGKPDIVNLEQYSLSFVPFSHEPERLMFLMAVKRNTSMFVFTNETISEGRWFQEGSNEMVISRYIAASFGVKIGDNISVLFLNTDVNVTVVGITNELMVSSTLIIDLDYLSSIFEPFPNSGIVVSNRYLVQLEDDVDIEILQDKLNIENPAVSIALSKQFYLRRMNALSASQIVIINLLIILGLIVGLVSVFTTILVSIAERERELALLNVFGYRRLEIVTQVLMEGLIIGTISLMAALLMSKFTSELLWIRIIENAFFEITPDYVAQDSINLLLFVLGSILISVLVSIRFVTEGKLAEKIREE